MEENGTKKVLALDVDGLLDRLGITQYALSEMTGISAQSISNMARGTRQVRLESLTKICQALKLQPNDLIVWVQDERK